MSSLAQSGLNRFKALYLKSDSADVWFKFADERIPAHKLILTTMSPWMNAMFFGSLPEGNEVNMTNSKLSADSFKEFLQFFYMDVESVTLTMVNIEGVLDLAKQSLTEHIFNKCENFLIKTVTSDTMCFGYQLALRYGANKLKALCEDEICVNAEKILRSSSFFDFPYEFLQNILQCDALACEEKYVFDACMAWAKAACKRNNEDTTEAPNLRAHLKDSIYQIRFKSMTKEEIAECIGSYLGLFSADELEEIICMNGNEATAKKFNWTPRYFNLQWDKGRHLKCKRFRLWSRSMHRIGHTETLTFSCNRRVLLNGFTCEANRVCQREIDFVIVEVRCSDEDKMECYSQKGAILAFEHKRKEIFSYDAQVTLNKAILLRPKHKYEIRITMKSDESDPNGVEIWNRTIFKYNVVVDFDILLRFDKPRAIISALDLIRFDDKNIFQKIVDAPMSWIVSFH